MKTKPVVLLPDHQLYTDAVEALKRYHEAQADGMPPKEIERLRLIAESQFQAISDYQLKALGNPGRTPH
ncbi:hypothetical protein [Pseudomonas sichuanensis]|uniref:hypothetical protein n=1 Tax=Pseudomonas sichuanensis TaxID=2213015 RepID=UPI002B414987|nr:hypothetical protein [Pseudomonas sichuanensis]